MPERRPPRAAARDPDELETLLQRGFRYALALTHNTARAEDLVQDACVSILRAGGPWQRGYLFTTIRNRFIDQYRRERLVVIEPLDDADRGDVQRLDWRETETFRAELDTLQQALATLRAEEREALYLAAVEGYTAAEVADLTHRPRGTVLSLVFRARQKVRRFCSEREREALP